MPQQYSTIDGHLTPTSPKPEDMRLEPSLNVMPEGSLGDLPNAVNAEETRERGHQIMWRDHKEHLLKPQLRDLLRLM